MRIKIYSEKNDTQTTGICNHIHMNLMDTDLQYWIYIFAFPKWPTGATENLPLHYSDVMARWCLKANHGKHQSSSLAFVRGIHRGPVNSPHKRPVTRKMYPFDDIFMYAYIIVETILTNASQTNKKYCCSSYEHHPPPKKKKKKKKSHSILAEHSIPLGIVSAFPRIIWRSYSRRRGVGFN